MLTRRLVIVSMLTGRINQRETMSQEIDPVRLPGMTRRILELEIGDSVAVGRRIALNAAPGEDVVRYMVTRFRNNLDKATNRARHEMSEAEYLVEQTVSLNSGNTALLIVAMCTRIM